MSILTETTAFFFPKRSIGGFSATVTIEEISVDELEITQHPVQQGASITDHAYKKPSTLTMSVMFDGFLTPLSETYQNFLDFQETLEPFDVVTPKRSYSNMLIKSMVQTTDVDTENVLSLQLELQEIIIVSIVTTTVPERSQQSNAGATGATERAGQKNVQQLTPSEQSSTLRYGVDAGKSAWQIINPLNPG